MQLAFPRKAIEFNPKLAFSELPKFIILLYLEGKIIRKNIGRSLWPC